MYVPTTNTQIAFRSVERVTRDRFARMREAITNDRRAVTAELQAAPMRLNGFPVQARAEQPLHPRLQRMEDALAQVQALVTSMDAFKAELETAGLTPLAIVPALLWDKLTTAFGVYRFDHFDRDGRVPAAPIGGLTKFVIKQLATQTIVRKLWPNRHDTLPSGVRIHPQFPAAPERFQQNLSRLSELARERRFPVCVAAAEEAIQVNRDEVLRAHQEHGLLRVMQPTPEQDPILYTRQGTNVAVLDYYGRFPNEERVVQWAIRYYAAIDRRN